MSATRATTVMAAVAMAGQGRATVAGATETVAPGTAKNGGGGDG